MPPPVLYAFLSEVMAKQTPKGEQVAASLIFKKFLGKAEEYIKKPTRIKQLLNDAYHKASEKNELGTIAHEAWETLQALFRMIRASISGEYTGLPTSTVVAAVAVTAYFLSPIDVVPDFIPVLGLLDDVALVAWFSTTIKEEMDKFLEWEKTRPTLAVETTGEPTEATSAEPSTSAEVVEDSEPAAVTRADAVAHTTDSSRVPDVTADTNRPSGGDSGGNVR